MYCLMTLVDTSDSLSFKSCWVIDWLNDLLVRKNCWDWVRNCVFQAFANGNTNLCDGPPGHEPHSSSGRWAGQAGQLYLPFLLWSWLQHTPSMDLWPPLPHLSLRTCQIRLELTALFLQTIFHSDKFQGSLNCFLMTSCNIDLRFSRLVVGAWSVLPLLSDIWWKVHEWKFGHYIFVSHCNFWKELECT